VKKGDRIQVVIPVLREMVLTKGMEIRVNIDVK
jgi:hypothetical protein